MRKVLFLFGALDDGDVQWMCAAGSVRRLSPGTVLIEEGREIECVFIVLDGLLAVIVGGAGGPREIARLHAGEVVGEMSFVDSRPTSATVSALGPTRVLAIPREDIRARLSDPAFAARFYRALSLFLSDRLRSTVARLGYGAPERTPLEPADDTDLDPAVLDTVVVAGARFDHLLRQLRER